MIRKAGRQDMQDEDKEASDEDKNHNLLSQDSAPQFGQQMQDAGGHSALKS